MNPCKTTFVAGLHGDELAPILALTELQIAPVIGNPQALLRNQRFIERDLNASFGRNGTSYEEQRAKQLLKLIPIDHNVVDFHTFSCESPPFALIVDPAMLPYAKKLGIKRIVHMQYNIKNGHALINYRNGVSVEVGRHCSEEAYTETQKIVVSLNHPIPQTDFELFTVIGILEPGSYTNFADHKDGFVPILAGESAYQHPGLKAIRCNNFKK